MIILALDQSTKNTGYAVFKDSLLQEYGIIKADGLQNMYFNIKKLIKRVNPNSIVIEDVFKLVNISVTIALANLQGLIFALAWDYGIKIDILHPKTWKSKAGIKSKNRKEQKLEAIDVCKFKFNVEVKDDIADAILIGNTYVQTLKTKKDDEIVGHT